MRSHLLSARVCLVAIASVAFLHETTEACQELDGPPFQATNFLEHGQFDSSVSIDQNDNVVVCWASPEPDGESSHIYARLNDGPDFLVSSDQFEQTKTDVSHFPDGDFIIVYESRDQDGGGRGIFGRYYDSNAIPYGPEFQVNTNGAPDQLLPRIAHDVSGNFVITYIQSDTGARNLYAQAYLANGLRNGPIFQVNTMDESVLFADPTFAPDGTLALAWETTSPTRGVRIRRFDGSMNPLDPIEFSVDETLPGDHSFPGIQYDSTGRFMVVWGSSSGDGDGGCVHGRIFNADGTPFGGSFIVNETANGAQRFPRVDQIDGGYVTAYRSGSSGLLLGRCIKRNGDPSGPEFLIMDLANLQDLVSLSVGNTRIAVTQTARIGLVNADIYCQYLQSAGTSDAPEHPELPRLDHRSTPNSFAASTAIVFDLPTDSVVDLSIFDVSGRRVRNLLEGKQQAAGLQQVIWDGADHSGVDVSNGVYYYRLRINARGAWGRIVRAR